MNALELATGSDNGRRIQRHALLADLQNTISPPGSGLTSPGSGYGSLNGPRLREHVVSTERYETSPASAHTSPTLTSRSVADPNLVTWKYVSCHLKQSSGSPPSPFVVHSADHSFITTVFDHSTTDARESLDDVARRYLSSRGRSQNRPTAERRIIKRMLLSSSLPSGMENIANVYTVLIMWTQENFLRLIELLHAAPSLWQVNSKEYRDRNKRGMQCEQLQSI
uniref:Uncharacterized protein n=1 Tax=Timema poppense TaxID=170557 RepID=A0A7R9CXU7_TIMPO|nr:unnamed protein product [Timema poppensis]